MAPFLKAQCICYIYFGIS